MPARKDKSFYFLFLLGGLVVFADVILKQSVGNYAGTITLVPGVEFTVNKNSSGPFGLLSLPLTIFLSVPALLLLIYACKKTASFLKKTAYTMIISGGLSNLGERIICGCTTDILLFFERGAWNLADIAILVGIIFVLVSWNSLVRSGNGQGGG